MLGVPISWPVVYFTLCATVFTTAVSVLQLFSMAVYSSLGIYIISPRTSRGYTEGRSTQRFLFVFSLHVPFCGIDLGIILITRRGVRPFLPFPRHRFELSVEYSLANFYLAPVYASISTSSCPCHPLVCVATTNTIQPRIERAAPRQRLATANHLFACPRQSGARR